MASIMPTSSRRRLIITVSAGISFVAMMPVPPSEGGRMANLTDGWTKLFGDCWRVVDHMREWG